MKRKTHQEYVCELEEKNIEIIPIEQYINNSTAILHRCMKHNIVWKTTPGRVLSGKGCTQCKKEKFKKTMSKTHDQYVEELKAKLPHITVLDTYSGKSTHVMHYCNIHNKSWNATPDNVLHSVGCPLCRSEAIGSKLKKSHQQYAKELNRINSNIKAIEYYIDALTPILHKCKIDGHEWNAAPANILSGRGCPVCKSNKLSKLFSKTHEQYVKEVAESNPYLEVLGTYINSHTPIAHRCKIDGYEWACEPANILFGQGCPVCKESSGERQIRQQLEKYGFEYIFQKTFDDCKKTKCLPFDFYLPEYNLCIEYDGEQHFRPVDYFGGEEGFKRRQTNDAIKNEYCKNNNIQLLRIPYFKNAQEELEKFFIHLI